jgi:hypothetical protein
VQNPVSMANPPRSIQNGPVSKGWSSLAEWVQQRLRPLVAIGVNVTLFLVVAVLPPLLAGGEDSENEVRGTLLQVVGGLVLLIGLYLTYRTFDLNRQGQVTERFTRAIDQLGEEKLDVRLGGIYALERIAWDSRRDHWPVMEVLTAYVREQAPHPSGPAGSEPASRKTGSRRQETIATDIQAVLTVLGRRNADYDQSESALDLRGTNLGRAILDGANLQSARLDRANLQCAHLFRANLHRARLGLANLQDAGSTG